MARGVRDALGLVGGGSDSPSRGGGTSAVCCRECVPLRGGLPANCTAPAIRRVGDGVSTKGGGPGFTHV